MDVPRPYDPETHFVLEVCGRSMEPDIPDGSLIVVRRLEPGTHPRRGAIVVYHDGIGASLKRIGYRKENHDCEIVRRPVLESLNPEISEVVPLEGAQIQAIFMEFI